MRFVVSEMTRLIQIPPLLSRPEQRHRKPCVIILVQNRFHGRKTEERVTVEFIENLKHLAKDTLLRFSDFPDDVRKAECIVKSSQSFVLDVNQNPIKNAYLYVNPTHVIEVSSTYDPEGDFKSSSNEIATQALNNRPLTRAGSELMLYKRSIDTENLPMWSQILSCPLPLPPPPPSDQMH